MLVLGEMQFTIVRRVPFRPGTVVEAKRGEQLREVRLKDHAAGIGNEEKIATLLEVKQRRTFVPRSPTTVARVFL